MARHGIGSSDIETRMACTRTGVLIFVVLPLMALATIAAVPFTIVDFIRAKRRATGKRPIASR